MTMTPHRLFVTFAVTTLLLASGCAKTTTEGIKTSFMQFYGTVESNADETTVNVEAWLTSEDVNGPYDELGDGETITVSNGEDTVTLEQDSGINSDHKFKGTIDYIEDATYTIAYNRKSDVSAPSSTVTLSSDMDFTSPTEDSSYTDGDPVAISWTRPSDYGNFFLTSNTTCHINGRDDVTGSDIISSDNSGAISVTIEKLLVVDPDQYIITQCEIDLELSIGIEGELDPAFGGGSMGGKIRRQVSIVYTPS